MSGVKKTYEKLKMWEKFVFHALIIGGPLMMVLGIIRVVEGLSAIP